MTESGDGDRLVCQSILQPGFDIAPGSSGNHPSSGREPADGQRSVPSDGTRGNRNRLPGHLSEYLCDGCLMLSAGFNLYCIPGAGQRYGDTRFPLRVAGVAGGHMTGPGRQAFR